MPDEAKSNDDIPRQRGSDFEELLQRAIAGDAEAVANVVESLRTYLLLIANQEVDRDLQAKFGASDLVQSALIVAHRKFAEFQGKSIDALQGWVRQILRHDLIDARRRFKGTARRQTNAEIPIEGSSGPKISLVDPMETPATLSSQHEQFRMVQNALSDLPPNYQKVIEMRNWQEMSFGEIGEFFGTGEDAARKLWSRALLRLKEVLNTKYPEMDSISWNQLK